MWAQRLVQSLGSRTLLAYGVLIVASCAGSRPSQVVESAPPPSAVPICADSAAGDRGPNLVGSGAALGARRPPRKLRVPMADGDDPSQPRQPAVSAAAPPGSPNPMLPPPRIPWMSYREADQALAEIARHSRDGDIQPACERIYYRYYSNNDSFYVESMPQTDADLAKMRGYQARLHAALGPCLPYLMDWYESFAMMQRMLRQHPRDPVLRQSYALFLEASDDDKLLHVAEVMLEELAASRQMTRAEGYAALARIRMRFERSPDSVADLVARCRAMTRRPHVCPTPQALRQLRPVQRLENL